MNRRKQHLSKSMKSRIRQHDVILAILLVVVCICSLIFNQMGLARYHAILESNLYLNRYKTALDDAHNTLEEMVYYGLSEDSPDYIHVMLALYQEGEKFHLNIRNEELWRDTIDLQHMTRTFLHQAGSAFRLLQTGYIDAALPIYMECSRYYELILQAYNDCYEKLIVLNTQEQQVTQRFTNLLVLSQLLFSMGVLAFSFVLIMRLVSQVVYPIEELTRRVSNAEVEAVHLERLSMEECGVEEVEALQQSYNRFIDRINCQFDRIKEAGNLERQLLEEEAKTLRVYNLLKASELKALQSQINPHFLFNSLNMIASSAYLEGAEQTTNLMELLGGYLRYNLDKGNMIVTAANEVENVKDYLQIQKVRMGERFDYSVYMDAGSTGAQVPSLILQPLVENAIYHGFRNCVQGGKIEVRITSRENRLQISVCDNGLGIEAEQLMILNALQYEDPLRLDECNGIGVRNVISRLQLIFNADVKVKITSEPGYNTEIFLDLPLVMENVNDGLYISGSG